MISKLTFMLLLLISSTAHAGIVIDLVSTPLSDPGLPPHTFYGHADVVVDVYLRQDQNSSDIFINYLQFDLSSSSEMEGIDFPIMDQQLGIPFWDISTVECGLLCYSIDVDIRDDPLGIISMEWILGDRFLDYRLSIPGDGTQVHIGTLEYFVPRDAGQGFLDLIRSFYIDPDPFQGAEIRFSTDPLNMNPEEVWRHDTSEISGGFIHYQVGVPEPSTLLLISISIGLLSSRRRRSN